MTSHRNHDATYATMCSALGLSARDIAEIGGFSERFARDLLAGRRPFPRDTKNALFQLWKHFKQIIKSVKDDVAHGANVLYIYRTNEQLRSSPASKAWPAVGMAAGAFVGPYRAVMFEIWEWASEVNQQPVSLVFAETPGAN